MSISIYWDPSDPTEKAPIPIMYRAHDPILHTDEQPFCSDMQCPCHDDTALYDRCVAIPLFKDGTLTIAEALRLFEGRQV